MPVNYHNSTMDNFTYETARMVNLAFNIRGNNHIEGDYAEFGVFEGRTFVEAYKSYKRCGGAELKFWAFDSFAGLPPIDGKDSDGTFRKGQYACSRPDFEKNLRKNQVDMSLVNIVEGFYDKTLSAESTENLGSDKISIAWIDCDLYESTAPVLNFLTDRLSNGAVLIFDDWFCYESSKKGERRACVEWLEANPNIQLKEYSRFHWAGMSFIVECE